MKKTTCWTIVQRAVVWCAVLAIGGIMHPWTMSRAVQAIRPRPSIVSEPIEGDNPAHEATPWSESCAALRAQAAENGALCAVAYLGYAEDIASFLTSEAAQSYRATYDFIWDIPEENYVLQEGMEIYCVVPVTADAALCVHEWVYDLDAERQGAVRYDAEGGAPILLRGNISDILPNLQVTVTVKDGISTTFIPCMSLRDGRLVALGAEASVYDFTIYPEGMVEESDDLI